MSGPVDVLCSTAAMPEAFASTNFSRGFTVPANFPTTMLTVWLVAVEFVKLANSNGCCDLELSAADAPTTRPWASTMNTSRSEVTPPQGCAHWRSTANPPPGATVTLSALSTPAPGSKSWHARRGSRASTDAGHEAARKAGASYDETFFPPTITFSLPAAEKYATPAWLAALAAFAIGPFWKNGSLK